jgi:hypothetical protein
LITVSGAWSRIGIAAQKNRVLRIILGLQVDDIAEPDIRVYLLFIRRSDGHMATFLSLAI